MVEKLVRQKIFFSSKILKIILKSSDFGTLKGEWGPKIT
jgi:hypothetical protein